MKNLSIFLEFYESISLYPRFQVLEHPRRRKRDPCIPIPFPPEFPPPQFTLFLTRGDQGMKGQHYFLFFFGEKNQIDEGGVEYEQKNDVGKKRRKGFPTTLSPLPNLFFCKTPPFPPGIPPATTHPFS